MARGRFLAKDISTSEKIADLPSDTDRMVWSFILPHVDREGRITANPRVLKAQCMPLLPHTLDEIGQSLEHLHAARLVTMYDDDQSGQRAIQYHDFEKHQQGMRKEREAPSPFGPAPTGMFGRSNSRRVGSPPPTPPAQLPTDPDKSRPDPDPSSSTTRNVETPDKSGSGRELSAQVKLSSSSSSSSSEDEVSRVHTRARDTPPPTSPSPMDEVECEACGGAGRTDRWGGCRICAGDGRHLAGGVDERTLALARAIARYLPEVNPSQADRLLHVWTDRHTPENVEHAIRQCAAELSEETPPDKALRLLRVFVENAPSHHDRHEGRRRNANGRDAERVHDATKTPEELRRRERRVRRDPRVEAAKERERLALAATAAKQALAAIGNGPPTPKPSPAPSSARTSEPEQENPDHATEPDRRDPTPNRPRPARPPTDDPSRTARPPTADVGGGGGDRPPPARGRHARGGGGADHADPPRQGGGDDPADGARAGEGGTGRGEGAPRGDGAAQAQPQGPREGDRPPADPRRAKGG